jgi:hypothetical protein
LDKAIVDAGGVELQARAGFAPFAGQWLFFAVRQAALFAYQNCIQ